MATLLKFVISVSLALSACNAPDSRRADLETYGGFHGVIVAADRKSGYSLVEVPRLDVGSRVRFVEAHVAQSERGD